MSKYISYSLIKYAFQNDNEISEYCDPDYKDKNIKQLCFSVYIKLLEYEQKIGGCDFDEIIIDGKIVGFVFCCNDMLVSFGINKRYRTKDNLEKVFNFIKTKFKTDFVSYMWNRNSRAINWLKKCGMKEERSKIDNVTKLKYTLCQ